jgi:hypothetical protein
MQGTHTRASARAQASRLKKVEALCAEIKRRYDQKNPDRELRLNAIAVKRISVIGALS